MKRALVTGGTRGIGFAVCALLAEKGFAVTATYSASEADAERARSALPLVEFVRADVSSEEDMRALLERFPRLDALVCNAGISHFGQVQDVTHADYTHVMDVNFGGVLFACKYAVKKMLGEGGAIVTVSSVWGQAGASCESLYSASKGAVISFTKALAKELAPSHITVNCVCPGVVDTAMNARFTGAERSALEAEIPLGRFCTADEIACAVCFLLEQPSVTGQVLGVNGGFYI